MPYWDLYITPEAIQRNFDIVFKITNNWLFNEITNARRTILTTLRSSATAFGIADYVSFNSVTTQSSTHTLRINFDAVTDSPVADWLIKALVAAITAVLWLINPVMGMLSLACLYIYGIFEYNRVTPTAPPPAEKVSVIVRAYLSVQVGAYYETSPLAGVKLVYRDRTGEITSNPTDNDGNVQIAMYENDVSNPNRTVDYESPLGVLKIGKSPNDTYEYPIYANRLNEIYFRFKDPDSGPFNVKVVTESGTPVSGATVVVPLVDDLRNQFKTNAAGIAAFPGLPRRHISVSALAISIEGTALIGTRIVDLTQPQPYPDPIATITVSDKSVITKILLGPNGEMPSGVRAQLILKATGAVVATAESIDGITNFLVTEDETALYEIPQEKEGLIIDTAEDVKGTDTTIIEHFQYDNCTNVAVSVVREDNINSPIPNAMVALTAGATVLGPQLSSLLFVLVPFGTYTVSVQAEGYAIVSADVMQVCSEACGPVCYWTVRMKDLSDPVGDKLRIKCKVVDEKNNPVPNALIQVDYKATLLWSDFDLATWATILTGETAITTDGSAVRCTDEGVCDFQVPRVGLRLPGDVTPINAYRICAGHKDYYNEKGKKGEWTEWIEITQSAGAATTFTLTSTPEVIPSMLLVCAIATAGLAVGGTIAKTKRKGVGTAVQLSALIPGALTAYEGYKYVKSKLGWLGR